MVGEPFPRIWCCLEYSLFVKDILSVSSHRPLAPERVTVSLCLLPSLLWVNLFNNSAVVVACTLYACYTEEDYTTSSLMVIILSVILMILFIVTIFTDSPLIRNIYCGVGVLLFSIYLIIDTQMIMGGKSVELGVD